MYPTVHPDWRIPPAVPTLDEGQVDIWRIPLDTPATAHADAHQALAVILAAYLGLPPGHLTIARPPGGKPVLEGVDPAIDFNLSHTRGIALLALTGSGQVGVDVEAQRRLDNPLRLARRVLSGDELSVLEGLHGAQRLARFLDLWTRMEARQKALGRGIFADPVDPGSLTCLGLTMDPGLFASVALSPPRGDLHLRYFDYRHP